MASGEGGGQTGHMDKQVRKGNVRGSEATGQGGERAPSMACWTGCWQRSISHSMALASVNPMRVLLFDIFTLFCIAV